MDEMAPFPEDVWVREISLAGEHVLDVTIRYSMELDISGGRAITIGCAMSLRLPDGHELQLDPEDSTIEQLQPARDLAGAECSHLELDGRSGTLTLDLADGRRVVVPKDGRYEAWEQHSPDGELVVCMPSGGLAVFPPRR